MSQRKNVKFENGMCLDLESSYDAISLKGLEINNSKITYKRGLDGNINNLMVSIKDNITNIVNEFTIKKFFLQGPNQLNYIAFDDKAIMVNEIFDNMSEEINVLISGHRALTPGNLKYNHLFEEKNFRFSDGDTASVDMNVKGNQRVSLKVESSNIVFKALTEHLSGAEDLIVDCIETR